jgi:adenine-specific DNA-methyltransferase
VSGPGEFYGLFWPGKNAAKALAAVPPAGCLRPCPEESVDWERTRNRMIEGENLEVLKLLRKDCEGRVKLVYIDPPYNTGKDFVYADDYRREAPKNAPRRGGNGGAEGASRQEAEERRHAAWLSMMYPRLLAARDLLAREGVLFVSCDEGEHPRLRLLLDEILGGANFVGDLVWAGGRKNDSRLLSVSHEYIVCYVRDAAFLKELGVRWRQRKRGLEEIYAQYRKLRRRFRSDHAAVTAAMKAWFAALPDEAPAKAHRHYSCADARGLYFPDNISWPGGGGPRFEVLHPRTGRPVKIPSRGWMTSDPEKMRRWIAEDRVHFGDDETAVPCFKSYLADREEQVPYSVFYRDGRAATKRLRRLMGGDCFDFPKDEEVLRELVAMVTDPGDLVLDFFAGSGSTGHAVLAQNALGEGDRHFLLVQSPEPLDPANKGQRNAAAYCDRLGKPRTIAELAKERLRRAGRAVAQDATRPGRARSSGENGALHSEGADCTEKGEAAESGGERALQRCGAPPDLGFRVYKLEPCERGGAKGEGPLP